MPDKNKKPFTNLFGTDVKDFQPNLWSFIGQNQTVDILRAIVGKHFNDRIDGCSTCSLPHIILIGRMGSGRKTLAKCIHSALGYEPNNFREALGTTLGMGMDLFEFFLETEEDSTIFINGCEHLSPYAQNILYKLINEEVLYVSHPLERTTVPEPYHNRLFIFSSEHTNGIISQLLSSIDVQCSMNQYSIDELHQIIYQRCHFMNLPCGIDGMRVIAYRANGKPSVAVRILQTAFYFMRNRDSGEISMDDINSAVSYFPKTELQKKSKT